MTAVMELVKYLPMYVKSICSVVVLVCINKATALFVKTAFLFRSQTPVLVLVCSVVPKPSR